MHSKHMIYIIYTSAITFLRVNTQKLKTGRIFNLHVQINKEINSSVKSSLKYVQLMTPRRFSLFGGQSTFCHTTEEAAFKLGRCRYCKSMSTFTINMSLFSFFCPFKSGFHSQLCTVKTSSEFLQLLCRLNT